MQNWDKKKLGIAAVVAVIVLAGIWLVWPSRASAADLGEGPLIPGITAVKGRAPWTGVYVGVGGGYQVGDTGLTLDCGECGGGGNNLFTADGLSGRGWVFDPRIGLDFQIPQTMIVAGVFGGYNWSWGDKPDLPDTDIVFRGGLEQTWYAGGRIGLAMPTKTLAYVGYAWTQAEVSASLTIGDSTTSDSKTIDGQMFLAGLEQMITPNLSLGAEYSLSRFDDICFELGGRALSLDPDVHAFKVRLNWRPFSK